MNYISITNSRLTDQFRLIFNFLSGVNFKLPKSFARMSTSKKYRIHVTILLWHLFVESVRRIDYTRRLLAALLRQFQWIGSFVRKAQRLNSANTSQYIFIYTFNTYIYIKAHIVLTMAWLLLLWLGEMQITLILLLDYITTSSWRIFGPLDNSFRPINQGKTTSFSFSVKKGTER